MSTEGEALNTSPALTPSKGGNKGGSNSVSSSGVSNKSSSGSKKKKKSSRRRGNLINKAADTILHATKKHASMISHKATYVVKMQAKKGRPRNVVYEENQFEDAVETPERELRQNTADALGLGRPPFGFFSLHASTLMLHPPFAVHHYYPSTPRMFNGLMTSPPPPPPYASAVSSSSVAQPHYYPAGLEQIQSIPKVPSRASQHPSSMVASQQQQINRTQQPHPAHLQAASPGFLEYARKRQQEQIRLQEAYKLQQESIHQEQLRQQREKLHLEQLQQQESTAVALVSMRTQPPAHHAAHMKMVPRGHSVMASIEGLAPNNTSANYMDHLSPTKDAHPKYPSSVSQQLQQHRLPPPKAFHEQPNVTSTLHRQQQKPVPPAAAEETPLEEQGAGAKQFVKRMITTGEDSPLTTGMEKLETLPMLPYTAPDSKKENPVREQEITNCDVLLGRGGMTNHHVGNMHFRTLVSSFRLHYCAAKKGDKGRLSKKLTNFVRHKNGRFLQKEETDNLWYEVGDNRAHGKCAQALREGTADLNKQVAGGGTAADPNVGDSSVGSYQKPYVARTTSGSMSSKGTASPSTSKYVSEADVIYRNRQEGSLPTAHNSQQPSAGGDEAGLSPAEERTRPQKRRISKTNSNGQARKVGGSSQGVRPTVTSDDEGSGNAEQSISRKSSSARSEDSGDQYDDDESAHDETPTDEASSRKRAKVQHVEEFEYI